MKKSFYFLPLLGLLLSASGCNEPMPSVTITPQPTSTPEESTTPEDSSTTEVTTTPEESTTPSDKVELTNTKVYVVGDSTLCAFEDSTYFYPRYGYATQLNNYLDEKASIVNYALSGRSSKSFTLEDNYAALKNNLSEGDYLLIGFGHNDEKSDDAARFTDADKPITDNTSFKYSLYENYIKIAEEKGAIPILATPIVRANKKDDYSGSSAHITSTGDYRKAIVELGQEKNVDVIDMTTLTKNYYSEVGYNNAVYLHAMTTGSSATEPNLNSVDTTHLNIYGAKMVAYLFANALKDSACELSNYVVNENLIAPTKEKDLIKNPSYVYVDYTAPDLSNYTPTNNFTTISEGWYGTGFGDTGGDPNSESNGYIAKETSKGVFKVGQHIEGGSNKGKFASGGDGFAFLFRQVDASKNFTLTAKAKVLTSANTKQAGFGLMLRDDVYLPIKDASKGQGNYISAGFLCDSSNMTAIFSRSSVSAINKSNNTVSSLYANNDEATFTITRLGQKVTVTVEYKGNTYTEEFLDFALTAKDNNYMYIGMFANRGTTVEFTDVVFEITGDAIVA